MEFFIRVFLEGSDEPSNHRRFAANFAELEAIIKEIALNLKINRFRMDYEGKHS